ncbi:MarR family transcriptional regulator [Corynebacterium suranareeae]|uniref:MarR family transcriptional regulator n=1 Tax=Corynebacterium suranareeae TaxID=2506452 RepID=A0A161JN80_9CORY|nr:MarR family transcriptional regulator [Corynebacterium suranareeae]BAU94368.1 MarR family transcriptional regulator [Corynebacterium suranareeae]
MTQDNLEYRNFAEFASSKVAELVPHSDPTANQLSVALNRVSHLLTYDFDATVHRPEESSWAAYRVIFVVWLAGPLTPARAAELTGMGKSAISNLLKPLLKQGYVTQEASAEDRRSKLLILTPKGEEYINKVFPLQNDLETQWSSSLTAIERDLLISLLNKLLNGKRAEEVREQRR